MIDLIVDFIGAFVSNLHECFSDKVRELRCSLVIFVLPHPLQPNPVLKETQKSFGNYM